MKKILFIAMFVPLFAKAQITTKRLDFDTTKSAYNQLTIRNCYIEGDLNQIRIRYTVDLVNSKGVMLNQGDIQEYKRYGTKYDSLKTSQVGQLLFGLFQLDASKVDSAKNVFRLNQTHP